MTEAAALFPDLFTMGTNNEAGPSSLTVSTPTSSIDSASAAENAPGSLTDQLASGVDNLNMGGPGGNHVSNEQAEEEDEILDFD